MTQTLPTLTLDEFVYMLLHPERKGAKIVTLVTVTEPDLPIQVKKIARHNGTLTFDYEKSVNRQRIREGLLENFRARPRAWGNHVEIQHATCSPLIYHNGQFYLNYKRKQVYEVQYRDRNNNILDSTIIENMISDRQRTHRQGVERPVICRNYKIENVKRITIDGETYDIES